MASVGLFLVGSYIGGAAVGGSTAAVAFGLSGAAIGGFVGGTVGSIIDSQIIFPALFGRAGDFQGPRIDDIQLQTASEGSPMKYVLGPSNRVGGTLIWMYKNSTTGKRIREVKSTSKQGGKGGGGGGSSTSYTYYTDVAIGVCEGPINSIKRIWANNKVVYEQGTEDDRYEQLWIYTGTDSQTPNSLIQAQEGVANTQAYRGTCYVVFKNLELTDFGQRLPQFTFEVEQQTRMSVRQALNTLLTRGGLASNEYNTDRVTGCMYGMVLSGPTEMTKALEQLLVLNEIQTQEINGVLSFFHLGDEEIVDVSGNDLAAYEMGGGGTDLRPLEISDVSDLDIAVEINANYIDLDRNLQQGSQRARVANPGQGFKVDTLQMNITSTSSFARQMVEKKLRRAYAERQAVRFTLPTKHLGVQEGDMVRVTVEGDQYMIRVMKVDRGANFEMRLEGVLTEAQTLSASNTAVENTPITPGTPYSAPDLTLELMDLPALREADLVDAGFYWAACVTDNSVEWRGGSVFESLDNATYGTLQSIDFESTLGTTDTLLPDGPTDYWDTTSTVEVTLLEGELESSTDLAVLNGDNTILIGNEIVGFVNATLIGTNQYRLSRLIRGLRNTEDETNTHTSSDRVVLLSGGTLQRRPLSLSAVSSVRYLKPLASGGDLADETAETLTPAGNALKPFSPAHVAGTRDGSNNLTLDWVRRSRALIRAYSTTPVPLLEAEEKYEVDIVSGSTVLRTITTTASANGSIVTVNGDGTAEAFYDVADISGDGLTPGDPVSVRVYQLSDTIGRGNAAEATV